MRRFLNLVLWVPLGLVFVVFAVANRHPVTVSFDPFDSRDPAVALALPLFVVIIMVAVLGVIAGGVATWIAQRRWRRAARQHEAEAARARSELADLHASLHRERMAQVPALPRPAAYETVQDKPRLTL